MQANPDDLLSVGVMAVGYARSLDGKGWYALSILDPRDILTTGWLIITENRESGVRKVVTKYYPLARGRCNELLDLAGVGPKIPSSVEDWHYDIGARRLSQHIPSRVAA